MGSKATDPFGDIMQGVLSKQSMAEQKKASMASNRPPATPPRPAASAGANGVPGTPPVTAGLSQGLTRPSPARGTADSSPSSSAVSLAGLDDPFAGLGGFSKPPPMSASKYVCRPAVVQLPAYYCKSQPRSGRPHHGGLCSNAQSCSHQPAERAGCVVVHVCSCVSRSGTLSVDPATYQHELAHSTSKCSALLAHTPCTPHSPSCRPAAPAAARSPPARSPTPSHDRPVNLQQPAATSSGGACGSAAVPCCCAAVWCSRDVSVVFLLVNWSLMVLWLMAAVALLHQKLSRRDCTSAYHCISA